MNKPNFTQQSRFTEKRSVRKYRAFFMGRGGFEPPKSATADLQSAPFGHSGTYPRNVFNELELAMGLEPATC